MIGALKGSIRVSIRELRIGTLKLWGPSYYDLRHMSPSKGCWVLWEKRRCFALLLASALGSFEGFCGVEGLRFKV